jgi:hypothetical protein
MPVFCVCFLYLRIVQSSSHSAKVTSMSQSRFNHIALLVSSVERASLRFRELGHPIGPTELWDSEGTKEIYIGDANQSGRVLLMEPTKPGSYQNALNKRGASLHHLAIDVLDLEKIISDLAGTGWLFHPNSTNTIKKSRTAWFSRPGIPTLIEVQERVSFSTAPFFVTGVGMKLTPKEKQMMDALGLQDLVSPDSSGFSVSFGQSLLRLADICL